MYCCFVFCVSTLTIYMPAGQVYFFVVIKWYTCPAAVGVPSNNPEVWSFFNDIPFLSINRNNGSRACHNINMSQLLL